MNRRKKILLLSVTCLLLSPSLYAQGLFGDPSRGDTYQGGRSLLSPGNRDAGIGINGASTEYPTLDPFANGTGLGGATEENPTPLGSGLLILVAAGAVYSLRKTKMKNKKSQI